MPTRLIMYLGIFVTFVISCKIFTLGHDFSKGPFKEGVRKEML